METSPSLPVSGSKLWTLDETSEYWTPNIASCARDVLANERTFLAWFRTSLLVFIIGLFTCSKVHLQPDVLGVVVSGRSVVDLAIGCTVMLLSMGTLALAVLRYARIVGLLVRLHYWLPPRGLLNVAYVAMAASILLVAILGVFGVH